MIATTMNEQLAENAKPPVWPVLFVLFGLPLALILAKSVGGPLSDFLSQHLALNSLPERLQHKLSHIMFVPMGALLVVLVRLTLGLRVLGPFRSILLAVTFQITGVALGLVFLTATIAIVVGLRPSIASLKLPYFGRITVMLSTVAVLMTLGVMASRWCEFELLRTIVYFPIVVLCLVADAFARTMNTEGIRSALWRGSMTVVVAVGLAALAKVSVISTVLLDYPELLVVQIGGIIVIARLMAWRLLERFNPKVGEDEEDEYEKEEEIMRARRAAFSVGTANRLGVRRLSHPSGSLPNVEPSIVPEDGGTLCAAVSSTKG